MTYRPVDEPVRTDATMMLYREASADRTYQGVPWISMLAPGVPDFEEFNAMEAGGGVTLAGCLCCWLPIIAAAYFCDHCAVHHAQCLGGTFCHLEGCGRCDVTEFYGRSPFPWEIAA